MCGLSRLRILTDCEAAISYQWFVGTQLIFYLYEVWFTVSGCIKTVVCSWSAKNALLEVFSSISEGPAAFIFWVLTLHQPWMWRQ